MDFITFRSYQTWDLEMPKSHLSVPHCWYEVPMEPFTDQQSDKNQSIILFLAQVVTNAPIKTPIEVLQSDTEYSMETRVSYQHQTCILTRIMFSQPHGQELEGTASLPTPARDEGWRWSEGPSSSGENAGESSAQQ